MSIWPQQGDVVGMVCKTSDTVALIGQSRLLSKGQKAGSSPMAAVGVGKTEVNTFFRWINV